MLAGLACALLAGPATAQAVDEPAAAALAERMFAAIGGRAAWADARGTINVSTQYRTEEPSVVRTTITMDFTAPRYRIETRAPGLHLVRVVDGAAHWRLNRAGAIEPVPEATLAEDQRWYAAHVYRTLHRVAARDSRLNLKLGREGRLEVFEAGARLAWWALDSRGEPYAFGAHEDEAGTVCGPWLPNAAGLPHPSWVAQQGGRWRAVLERLVVNPPLPSAWFERPTEPARATLAEPASLPWFLVTLSLGPNWDANKPAQQQGGFAEHSAGLARLRQQGWMLMGGRTAALGVMLLAAPSEEAVRQAFAADPMVHGELFRMELQPIAPFHRGSTGGVAGVAPVQR